MISSKATLLLIHRTYFIFTTLYKQEVVCWLTGIHTHTLVNTQQLRLTNQLSAFIILTQDHEFMLEQEVTQRFHGYAQQHFV